MMTFHAQRSTAGSCSEHIHLCLGACDVVARNKLNLLVILKLCFSVGPFHTNSKMKTKGAAL